MTRIGYVVNQYPAVSHGFIRREIEGLEKQEIEVLRFAIRPSPDPLVDPADHREREVTTYLLAQGLTAFVGATAGAVVRSPGRFIRSLLLSIRLGWRSERGLFRHLVYLVEACLLVRHARKSGIEHVHAHFGTNSTTVAMLAHELGGPPYSFTVHGPEEFDKPAAIGLREKIARSSFTIAISSFGRSQLYRCADQGSWHKIHVVRCGLGAAYVTAPEVAVPSTSRLVCVGRLCPEKGQLLLLDAVRLLADEGRPCDVVLAGDGLLRRSIEDRIQLLGLVDHVRITGWLTGKAVIDTILSSRAMVLPSFAEGLPVVLMEALALRRPVISTYVAGIPELVEPSRSGWLVPAGSIEDLAGAMREVLDSSTERLFEMGVTGRARVLERHSIDKESARLAHHLRRSVDMVGPSASATSDDAARP